MSTHEVMIGGVKLKFPNKPYPSQMSMMDKIIRGLKLKQNCLLESPTGSGKTLSLLCASIAWQIHERESIIKAINEDATIRAQKVKEACYCDCRKKKNLDDENEPKTSEYFPNKKEIVYDDDISLNSSHNETVNDTLNESKTSNKEKQCPCICHGMYSNDLLNDIARESEIKKIQKVPTIYFATRTHKQITNVINEFRKTPYAKNVKMTILASRQHTCIHPQISKMANKNDLCKKLNKEKKLETENENERSESLGGCTYYNRLRKNQISYENFGFKQNTWDIEDLVHLLKRKRLCPYYATRELMEVVDIIFCPYNYLISPKIRSSMKINLESQIVIIDEAHNIEDTCRESTNCLITRLSLESSIKELDKFSTFNFKAEQKGASAYFINVFQKLISWIDRFTEDMDKTDFDGSSMSKIWSGLDIVAEFKLQGIGPDKFDEFKRNKDMLFSVDDQENATETVELPEVVMILLDDLNLILEFLYMENHEFMDDFKVAITKKKYEEIVTQSEDETTIHSYFKPTQQSQMPKWNYTINFWCLNPAVAFFYLKKCHSVILCSGTLSPMDTFQSELGVKFEHQLEANHVIKDKQVWVGCLGSGPTNVSLQATYKVCETLQFQDEMGRLVLDICRTIPFGVLFFVPSYALLNKLLTRWSVTKIDNEIKKYKSVFCESKVAKNFDLLLKDYYNCIDTSDGEQQHNGALLLAVYRGRASEGLDFSDNYGRAVIACGIPYPNVKDVQVDLKRSYNKMYSSKKNLLSGDDWYEIQAYRAVNQALGRCIRHRNDWGAIILVDDRYFKQPQKYTKGLSRWIRQKFKTYKGYSEALNSLKEFSINLKDFKGDIEVTQTQPEIEPNQSMNQTLSESTIVRPRIEIKIEKEPPNSIASSLSKFQYKKSSKLTSLKSEVDETMSPGLNSSNLSTSTQISSIKRLKNEPEFDVSPITGSKSVKRSRDFNQAQETNLNSTTELNAKRSFRQIFAETITLDDSTDSQDQLDFLNDDNTTINNIKIMNTSIEELDIRDTSLNTSKKVFNFRPIQKSVKFECYNCKFKICDYKSDEIVSELLIEHLPIDSGKSFENLSILADPVDQSFFEVNTNEKKRTNENWLYYECKSCDKLVGLKLVGPNQDLNNFVDKIVLINK